MKTLPSLIGISRTGSGDRRLKSVVLLQDSSRVRKRKNNFIGLLNSKCPSFPISTLVRKCCFNYDRVLIIIFFANLLICQKLSNLENSNYAQT